jgi:hypothetical protein
MRSSQISSFHQVIGEILHDSIGGIETENVNLKDHLNEFEQDFIATLEFSSPMEKILPTTTVAKMKLSSTLLPCSRALVENNINKRMKLVTKAWETSQNLVSFGKKANDFL